MTTSLSSRIFRRSLTVAVAGVVATFSLAVKAQTYPAKVVTFVAPFAAGSATDQLARALGNSVTRRMTSRSSSTARRPNGAQSLQPQVSSQSDLAVDHAESMRLRLRGAVATAFKFS